MQQICDQAKPLNQCYSINVTKNVKFMSPFQDILTNIL